MTNLLKRHSNLFNSSLFEDVFDSAFSSFPASEPAFPKYNLIDNGDGTQTIEVAVAGYSKDQLEVFVENNYLYIAGIKTEKDSESESKRVYLRKNIAERSFSVKFAIKSDAEVGEVSLENGILTVGIKIKAPEKPKRKMLAIK